MRGEDDADRLLRVIREQRDALIKRLVDGVSPENTRGSYIDLVGEIRGLAWCEAQVIEQLRGRFPEEVPRRHDPYETT